MKKEKTRGKSWICSVFAIPFSASPFLSTVIILQTIISALVPTIQIILVGKFIDGVIQIVKNQESVWNAAGLVVGITLLVGYQWLSASVMNLVWVRLENKLRNKLMVSVVEKTAKLQYQYIENDDFWNLIQRVSENPEGKVTSSFRTLINFVGLVAKTVGIVAIIVAYVWWAALLIILVSIPMFWLSVKSGRATYEANQEITGYQRKFMYYGDILTGRDSALERTIFGYEKQIGKMWDDQYEKATHILLRAFRIWYTKLEMGSISTAFITTFVILILIQPTITGTLSIGLFVSLVNSCFKLVDAMSWEMRDYVDNLAEHREYLKEFDTFFQLEEKDGAIDEKKCDIPFNTIEFKNVSFKYPDSQKYVLKNMSFKLENGIHYAIVGKNGEGKTTIIKLLTGLYDNFEGQILINGKSIKEYKASELKGLYASVYQDYAKYSISLKENIGLGNQSSSDTEIKRAGKLFGLDKVAENLQKGWDHVLGKIDSEGLDLSGGEWQKIALARAYINNAPIHLMDEPTAALDPLSESKIYGDFQKICENRTTIIISHRLGSVKFADKILVLDNGCVVESGTHDDLMGQQGLYYEMFSSQRSWYE